MGNSYYFHFILKREINKSRSAKFGEKESLGGHQKLGALKLDTTSAHFTSHSKKFL